MLFVVFFLIILSSCCTWEHSGHVHFATDTWLSLNHCAFVVWTIYLHHEGSILVFLLDIIEVPEVTLTILLCWSDTDQFVPVSYWPHPCMGVPQDVDWAWTQNKVLSYLTCLNILCNWIFVLDSFIHQWQCDFKWQTDWTPWYTRNSFESINHVWCYNHTMQLSVKALLKPFNTVTCGSQDNNGGDDSDMPDLAPFDEDGGDKGDDTPKDDDDDGDDNNNDPLATLDNEEREQLMENMDVVHITLNQILDLCCFGYINQFAQVCKFQLSLSTQLPLPSLPGTKLMLLVLSMHASSPMMLKPNGILHTTCWKLCWSTVRWLTTLWPTSLWNSRSLNWMMRTGPLLKIFFVCWK